MLQTQRSYAKRSHAPKTIMHYKHNDHTHERENKKRKKEQLKQKSKENFLQLFSRAGRTLMRVLPSYYAGDFSLTW